MTAKLKRRGIGWQPSLWVKTSGIAISFWLLIIRETTLTRGKDANWMSVVITNKCKRNLLESKIITINNRDSKNAPFNKLSNYVIPSMKKRDDLRY